MFDKEETERVILSIKRQYAESTKYPQELDEHDAGVFQADLGADLLKEKRVPVIPIVLLLVHSLSTPQKAGELYRINQATVLR